MKATIDAVYSDGVFRPVQRPDLPEGSHVRITVETAGGSKPEDVFKQGIDVYEGLSTEDVDFDTVPAMLRTVLIADENPEFRKFLRMPLAARGFRVFEAGDGVGAWALAKKQRPWLILSDVRMPELDGFEVCRRVRAHRSHHTITFTIGDLRCRLEGCSSQTRSLCGSWARSTRRSRVGSWHGRH